MNCHVLFFAKGFFSPNVLSLGCQGAGGGRTWDPMERIWGHGKWGLRSHRLKERVMRKMWTSLNDCVVPDIPARYRILHCLHEYFSDSWSLKSKDFKVKAGQRWICIWNLRFPRFVCTVFLSPFQWSRDLSEHSIPIQIFSFPFYKN